MSKKLLDPRINNNNNSNNDNININNNGITSSFGTPFIVDPMEAERIVENLILFKLEDVGSSLWMQQHEKLEKLNLQAHQSALSQSDEFILESILTFSKIEFLINDLLVIEAWKEYVFPILLERLAGRNSMRLYFILYHEATIINLLEIFLYHKHVCESGGERLLELVDYVARKLTKLNGGYDFRGMDSLDNTISQIKLNLKDSKEFTDTLQSNSPIEELNRHFKEIEFRVCISTISIARFLSEHSDNLPLSVISRICDTHDLLMLIIPLIENPPWTRRLTTGKWQKLIDFRWQEVPPIDLLKVTKLEGQAWITFYFLLVKKIFLERYQINSFRKGQILRLRKYLNEIMLDQLPFLVDVQRYLDEITITDMSEALNSNSNSVFLFQQISVIRENLIRNKDWNSIAEQQINQIFTMEDKNDMDLRSMASLYADDLVEDVIEPLPDQDEFEEINTQLRNG